MKDNSIRRAVREGRAALGTGLKEFASRGVPWIIEASGFDYSMARRRVLGGRMRASSRSECGALRSASLRTGVC